MNTRMKFLALLAFPLPALNAAAIRLLEVNGDAPVIERVVSGVRVPRDGVVVIIPDRIFSPGW